MKSLVATRYKLAAVLAVAALLPLGCSDGPTVPEPQPEPIPTTIQLDRTEVSVADGSTEQIGATVFDQDGDALSDVEIAWSSAEPEIATVSGGVVEGRSPGQTRVTASAAGLSASASVTVVQVPAAVGEASAAEFSATAGTELEDSLAVRVIDRHGDTVAGVAVEFVVTQGDGAVSPASTETDEAGIARAAWTLGSAAGENTVEARVAGVDEPVVFSATGQTGSIASVSITPETIRLASLGESEAASAQAVDANGNVVASPSISWRVLGRGVATVDSDGVVRAVANGSTRLVASVGGAADTADVVVQQVAASLEISPRPTTLEMGHAVILSIEVADAGGSAIDDIEVAWSSSNENVVRVDDNSTLRTWGLGTARVIARSGEAADTLHIEVVPPSQAQTTTETVSPAGGTVSTQSGTSLHIPAGALQSTTTITIEPALIDPDQHASLVPGTAFEFGPDGTRFNQPVTITIPYDQGLLPAGVTEDQLRLFRLESSGWVQVPNSSVDVASGTVSGQTTHFSLYAVRAVRSGQTEITVSGPLVISAEFGRNFGARFVVIAENEESVQSLQYTVNGGPAQGVTITPSDSVESRFAIPYSQLQRGDNVIVFTAVDAGGERATLSWDLRYISAEEVGTTEVDIVSPLQGASVSGDSVHVEITASGDSIFIGELYLVRDDGTLQRIKTEFFFGRVDGVLHVPSEVQHTFSFASSVLSAGTNTLRVEIIGDNSIYGGTGAAEVTVNFAGSSSASVSVGGGLQAELTVKPVSVHPDGRFRF